MIVSLFIVGTLTARVTVPENVMYEVPEPEPESVTDVTEEPEHTSDAVGHDEEKDAEIVSLVETDDTSGDEGEIDLPPVPSDVEENQEIADEPVETETTETSKQPKAEVTEASVEIDSEATEEVSQPEDAAMEDPVNIEVSEDETSADVVAQDVVPDEGNEPIEMVDEVVTIDEPSEVTEAELEVSEQPSAETEEASVETDPETTEEVSQPEDVVMKDSVDIEVSEDETSANVVAQDVVPDEGNEPTEMADEIVMLEDVAMEDPVATEMSEDEAGADVANQDLIPGEENEPTETGDGIVTIDEPSDTVTEEEPVEGSRMKLLIGMEATHFAWSIEDGAFVAGHPLPCSGVFVAGLLDDRYMFGADTRILLSADSTSTNANLEVLGRFGMFFPIKRLSNNESVLFAESDLFLGTAVRNDAGNTSVYPVVGFAGRIHLGREFLTMAFGTDVTMMFPVSDADKVPSYTIRPNVSLMWNL